MTQLGIGASTWSNAPRFIEHQQSPPFTGYEDEAVDEHGLTASQHYQMICDEQAAFIEQFSGYRFPSYDSACQEYSD